MSAGYRVTIAFALLAALAPAQAQEAPSEPPFDAQFESARQHAVNGRRAEAIAEYTALLKRSPGNADVLLGRGRVYTWNDQYELAEADLKAATRASPRYADAWSALGDLYLWSDRPAEAAKAYGRWVALAPGKPEPYLARAKARRKAGDAAGAAEDERAAEARGAKAAVIPVGSLAPDVTVPLAYHWSASLSGSGSWFDPGSDRGDAGLSLRRHWSRGSLAAELLRAYRFGLTGTAAAADAYAGLWPRAYANFRYQKKTDGSLFADESERIELYQGVGHGWEPAVSWDRLTFGDSDTDLYGLALGKYTGDWYLRGRLVHIPSSGTLNFRVLARDYYAGDGDDYVEIAAGTSRSPEDLNQGLAGSSSRSLSLTWVHFWTPRWGFKLGADYGTDTGVTEYGVGASLYSRW